MNLFELVTTQPHIQDAVLEGGSTKWLMEHGIDGNDGMRSIVDSSLESLIPHMRYMTTNHASPSETQHGRLELISLLLYTLIGIGYSPTEPNDYLMRKALRNMLGAEFEEPGIGSDFETVFQSGFTLGMAVFREYAKTLTEEQLRNL